MGTVGKLGDGFFAIVGDIIAKQGEPGKGETPVRRLGSPVNPLKQLRHAPRVIRQPRRVGWRLLDCRVDSTEIVVRKPERERGLMVLPFLAVGIRQASHSSDRHSDRQVGPLGMAGADSRFDRVADSDNFVRTYYFPRRVTSRGPVLWGVAISFNQLSEVDVLSEDERNRGAVRRESVGRKLKPSGRRVVELGGETERSGWRPLVEVPSEDQFRVPL